MSLKTRASDVLLARQSLPTYHREMDMEKNEIVVLLRLSPNVLHCNLRLGS